MSTQNPKFTVNQCIFAKNKKLYRCAHYLQYLTNSFSKVNKCGLDVNTKLEFSKKLKVCAFIRISWLSECGLNTPAMFQKCLSATDRIGKNINWFRSHFKQCRKKKKKTKTVYIFFMCDKHARCPFSVICVLVFWIILHFTQGVQSITFSSFVYIGQKCKLMTEFFL